MAIIIPGVTPEERKILTINYSETASAQEPVSSLTTLLGTKWVINSEPTLAGANTDFNINFTSNNTNYIGMTHGGTTLGNLRYVSYDGSSYTPTLVLSIGRMDYEDLTSDTIYTWTSQAYRIIEITGGNDVTNTDLIQWLEANATQINVTDLTNTKWVMNQHVDFTILPSKPGGNTGFEANINFSSNNVNFTVWDYDYGNDTVIYYNDTHVFNADYYNPPWVNQAYRIIEITGGLDVTNLYFIAFLTENATQVPVVDLSGTTWAFGTSVVIENANQVQDYAINYSLEVEPNAQEEIPAILENGTSFKIYSYTTREGPSSIRDKYIYDVRVDVTGSQHFGGFMFQGLGQIFEFYSGSVTETYPQTLDNTVSFSPTYVKKIMISNGTDIANPDLIVWLTENATLQPQVNPYLTFSSLSSFTLNVIDNLKYWDGTLEYSTDKTNWSTWSGTTTLSSASDGTKHNLYLRGTGNTYITGSDASLTTGHWVLTGSNISCDGNIENLLDYQTVANGNHPYMEYYCYSFMFAGCTSLISAPELPATELEIYCYRAMFLSCASLTTTPELPAPTLATGCYIAMFAGCTSLTSLPELPATELEVYCYQGMFHSCTNIKLSATQTGNYEQPYRIPTSGTGTVDTDALTDMFTNTGGTFTGTPTINTTYYLWEDSPEPSAGNISVGNLPIVNMYFGLLLITKMYFGNFLIYKCDTCNGGAND